MLRLAHLGIDPQLFRPNVGKFHDAKSPAVESTGKYDVSLFGGECPLGDEWVFLVLSLPVLPLISLRPSFVGAFVSAFLFLLFLLQL